MAVRILVVDDQPDIGLLVQVMLESRHDVHTCVSYAEAIREARAVRFDLVVIDINLQNTYSGADVLHDLRRLPGYGSVPMIALTGYAAPENRARFLAEGFDGYLEKPFTRDRLTETVEWALAASLPGDDASDDTLPRPAGLYRIDRDDVLVDVDERWVAFARDNGAGQLERDRVVGRSLWDFIADDTTQRLYRMLLDRVRGTRHPLTVPFRCDGPSCRRFMELEIRALADDSIEFSALLLRTEKRPAVPLLEADAPRGDASVTCCSWCKRVYVAPAWVELEDAVRSLGLVENDPPPRLTHGVCPDCYETITERLNAA